MHHHWKLISNANIRLIMLLVGQMLLPFLMLLTIVSLQMENGYILWKP